VKVEVTASPFDRPAVSPAQRGSGDKPSDRPSDSSLSGGSDPPSFPPPVSSALSPVERVIEELIYEHLADLVDLPRLNEIERLVGMRLVELYEAGALPGLEADELADRAAAILDHAWHTLIDDPRRFALAFAVDDECAHCRELERERGS